MKMNGFLIEHLALFFSQCVERTLLLPGAGRLLLETPPHWHMTMNLSLNSQYVSFLLAQTEFCALKTVKELTPNH